MSALHKTVPVCRRRSFVACLVLAALAAVNIPAMLKATSASRPSMVRTARDEPTRAASGAPPAGVGRAPRASKLGAPAPRLEFSTTQLDLGDGKPEEILRRELRLTNRSPGLAKFSLVKHCGCTELSPMDGELAAGASVTVHVGVELPDHANSEKNTSVEVRTGEAADIVARCVLQARCPAPLQVAPGFISFGSLTVDELANASAEIRLDSVAGEPPLDPEEVLVEHENHAFRVERVGSSPPGGAISLRISVESELGPGDQRDAVEIRLAGSDYGMRGSLNLTVVEPITVVPRTVVLRKDPGREAFRPVALLVMARAGSTLSGTVSLAEGPEGVHIDDLGEVAPGRRRIRVSLTGEPNDWPRDSQVWLECGPDGKKFGFMLVKPSA